MDWLWWFWFCLESIALKMAMSLLKKYKGNYIQQEDVIQTICSPLTIKSLKEMVTKSTEEVWAFTEIKNQIYSAQITLEDGFLLLKSLSKRKPPANAVKIPYSKIKNLVDRENITIFLEIKFSEEDNSNFGNRFIHIKLCGAEDRHLQFEVMCTGEVDGISYANTAFLETDTDEGFSFWRGLCGGARNDGQKTSLPGFTKGETVIERQRIGLVDNFWDNSPTNFMICTENSSDEIDMPLGNVVLGMDDVQKAYSKAKEKGAGFIHIDSCGILLD